MGSGGKCSLIYLGNGTRKLPGFLVLVLIVAFVSASWIPAFAASAHYTEAANPYSLLLLHSGSVFQLSPRAYLWLADIDRAGRSREAMGAGGIEWSFTPLGWNDRISLKQKLRSKVLFTDSAV